MSDGKPRYKLPPGSCDAHCHVFGPAARFPYAPDRRYTPEDAPKEALAALHARLGIERAVIVQASCHGTDNRAMLDAVASAPDRYRGVAIVDDGFTDSDFEALHRGGVRGVRFNFVRRLVDVTPRHVLERIAARVAPLDWHIVVYFEMPDLPDFESFFTSLPTTVVVDHMGVPTVKKGIDDPENRRFLRMLDTHRNIWSKVTCPERMTLAGPPYDDVVPFGRRLIEHFQDRVIWGTDWPHPNMKKEAPDDGVLVDWIPKVAPSAAEQKALLVDNPTRLYWM